MVIRRGQLDYAEKARRRRRIHLPFVFALARQNRRQAFTIDNRASPI
jgi:hypothetical protein